MAWLSMHVAPCGMLLPGSHVFLDNLDILVGHEEGTEVVLVPDEGGDVTSGWDAAGRRPSPSAAPRVAPFMGTCPPYTHKKHRIKAEARLLT